MNIARYIVGLIVCIEGNWSAVKKQEEERKENKSLDTREKVINE